MKHLAHFAAVTIFVVSGHGQAQRPESGIWWGISSGASVDERLQISETTDGIVIVSVPLAKAAVTWGPIAVAADGMIGFHRAGDPAQRCELKRTEYGTYEGSCRGPVTRPLTLARHGNPGGLEIAARDADLEILAKTRQILSGPPVWNRHDDRVCDDSRAKQSWSLYCALDQASLDVTGNDLHLRPVMQESRAAIVEVAHRSFQRSLQGFNNLESTTYPDVVKVFDATERRLRAMKACLQAPPDASMLIGSLNGGNAAGRPVHYWRETIGHTLNGRTFELDNVLSPMDQPGAIPDVWVSRSTGIKRRSLPDDTRHLTDVSGTLPDGLHWRYASICGESLQYTEASSEAADYFDRLIDSAYFSGSKTVH